MSRQGFPSTPSRPRIVEMFAFVTDSGEDGQETLAAFLSGGTWYPMFTTDRKVMELMRVQATALARQAGKEVRLLHFSSEPAVMEVFSP